MIGKWLRRLFLSPPVSLLFEVTTRCNLDCAHCYNVWKGGQPYCEAELPPQAAADLVRKAARAFGCTHFAFTGGEPTLRADLEDLVRAARSVCPQVNLITNGTLLSEDRTRSLIDAGVSLFELPLNSADGTTHNRMAGGIDCFDQVTRAAAMIRAQGAELALVFVGTSQNIDHWEDALQLGIALGARAFLFNRYNAGGRRHGAPETLMPSVDQVRRALDVAERTIVQYGVAVSAAVPIPRCLIDLEAFPHVGFGFCAAGTDRAYWTIDPLGNVRPCNHSPTILGNILHQSARAIKRSPALGEFKRALPPSCTTCATRSECCGGCAAAAQVCYGSLAVREPFLQINAETTVGDEQEQTNPLMRR